MGRFVDSQSFALLSPCVNSVAEYDSGVGGSQTVLVADDDAQLLRLLVRLLERAGHRVLPASNSAAAIESFRTDAGELISSYSTWVSNRTAPRNSLARC